jgi:nitroimidazol reductase NimA-like FMN-containing flavoprotein (pyridoxamine 5'-phosphate oxidase superfamily)
MMDDRIRQKIQAALEENRTMTLATLRPDGWPQATTFSFAADGLTLYFLCGPDSQKAANLARDDRVSLTISRHGSSHGNYRVVDRGARASRDGRG